MSVLSQEIVDVLNQANGGLGEWLEQNPVVRNFVTCPYISIRPTAIPQARRITAFDGERGRFVDICYRDGSHRYIINVASWNLTVAGVESLATAIDEAAGSCHVERAYLIVFVPVGYSLEVTRSGSVTELQLRQLEAADIGLA
jgi:hypothetical protein